MASAPRDYYATLGVARDADEKAIKSAFRTQALKYHPDRNKDPGAEEQFRAVAEAYAVLSDPKKRADYDAGRLSGDGETMSPEDMFSGVDLSDLFGGLGFDVGGGGRFDHIFRRRPSGPPRGGNLEVDLVIPLSLVATGGEESVRVRRPVTCTTCNGSGAKPGTAPKACATCGGTGHQANRRRKGGMMFEQVGVCPTCGGQGQVIETPCPKCHGRGTAEQVETLKVKIPRGIEEGMVLRVAGHGLPGPAGGAPGDLYAVVRTAPDASFERRGNDLWHAETVHVVDAVLGTSLTIPLLQGTVSVKVPPGTQPGTVLRLRGKGLPEFGGHGHGDLYLRLDVRIPRKLSHEEHELFERLHALKAKAARGK